jgi:hypothetical protein
MTATGGTGLERVCGATGFISEGIGVAAGLNCDMSADIAGAGVDIGVEETGATFGVGFKPE